MILLFVWLLGAIFTFFWSYPGGYNELKRDWHSYKNNIVVYAGGMLIVWLPIFVWVCRRKNRLKMRSEPMPRLKEVK